MSYVNKIQVENIYYDLKDEGAIRFDESQSLTSSQKEQARSNIGATNVAIDDTLTVAGSAADAKATGDEIADLKSAFTTVVSQSTQLLDKSEADTGAIQSNGTVSTEGAWANYKTSDYIAVESGKSYTFYIIKPDGELAVENYRLMYVLFDSSKSVLSSTYFNTDYLNKTVITPAQDGYIRVSTGNHSGSQYAFTTMAMFVEGTSIVPYQEYYHIETEKLANTIHFNTTQNTEAGNAAVDKMASDSSHTGTVAIEPEWTAGYCNKSGTITTGGADYKYSQLIDVSEGDYVQCYDSTNAEYCNFRFVTAYSNGAAVSAKGQEGGYSYTVPSGIDQIRLTGQTVADLANSTIYNRGTIADKKVKSQYLPSIGNVLYNKKWAVCGDSFTAYTNKVLESGDYIGSMATYPFLIGNRNQMDIVDTFASSGRTLAYPSDGTFSNSLCCSTDAGYYQNIPADADYITIMLGINDYGHSVGESQDGESTTGEITLGTIDDATTATYYGAWNVVLGWLRANRPFAHVGIIVSNGIGVQTWVDAIIAVAKKWGYPIINLNGDEHTPTMIRAYNPDVPAAVKATIAASQAIDIDGTETGSINTHPNWQTHEYESVFIENWLRSL